MSAGFGAGPAIPSIPGIENVDCLTSTSALNLKKLPASLLVIGGGYIGAELAQTFAHARFRSGRSPEPAIRGALVTSISA